MALTQVQKVEILKNTGWPFGAIEPNHIDFNSTVARVINSIPDYIEPMVLDLLEKIKAVDAKQLASANRHGVKKIDDIEFFENASNTSNQQMEKNRIVKELLTLLGLQMGCYGQSAPTSGFGMKGVSL